MRADAQPRRIRPDARAEFIFFVFFSSNLYPVIYELQSDQCLGQNEHPFSNLEISPSEDIKPLKKH